MPQPATRAALILLARNRGRSASRRCLVEYDVARWRMALWTSTHLHGMPRARALGLGLAGLASLAVLAHAQDTAPPSATDTDTSVRVGGAPAGGLRQQIENAFARADNTPPPASGGAPEWQLSPALTVQQEWTDNAYESSGAKQSSFITVVTPEIAIAGTTSRLTASLFYAPSLYHYESGSGQDRIGQNLDAQALITLVPDTFFLDLRGFAAQQSLYGATGPTDSVALSRGNTLQTYSFSATPYLLHRFGGWGTGELGVSDIETSQGVYSGTLGNGLSSQSVNTRREFASFTSGENFGRILSTLSLSASQSSGSGALDGAHRNIATYQAGYAINRFVTALASVGWEDIKYGNPDPYKIDDATWTVGARLTPSPDSSITALYGHQDGVTAASLDASVALAPRTRLYANYSEGVSTDTEQLQNALSNAQLDGLGNPVNATTGAPLLLTDNFFGFNSSVYHVRNASATLSWLGNRDAVQASVTHQEQTPVGPNAAANGAVASRGTYGSLAWEHEVSQSLRTNLYGQYGKLNQAFGTGHLDTDVVVATAAATWQMSETLSGSLQYSYTSDSYASLARNTAANLVVVGLRKTF